MKKIYLILFCGLMFATNLNAQTWSIGATTNPNGVNGVIATLDAGTLTISGTGEMVNWNSAGVVPWFSVRSSIQMVVINEGITNIGAQAFAGTSITSAIVPNSVTTLGNRVFEDCPNLTSIVFGSNVSQIGSQIFVGSTNLTSVTVLRETPPNLAVNPFVGVNFQTVCLHIPDGSMLAFRQASGWGSFLCILPISCGTNVIAIDSLSALITAYSALITTLRADTLRLYNQVLALQNDTVFLRQLLALCEDDNDLIGYIDDLNNTIDALRADTLRLHQLLTVCNADLVETRHALSLRIDTINLQRDTINIQRTTINSQQTTINYQRDTINDLRLFVVELVEINDDLLDTIAWLRQLLAECENNSTNVVLGGQTPPLQVYPNPVTNVLHITHEWQSGDVVELFDMNGRRVFSQSVIEVLEMTGGFESLSHRTATFTIDMSPFPSGNYILRIGNRVAKIVKR